MNGKKHWNFSFFRKMAVVSAVFLLLTFCILTAAIARVKGRIPDEGADVIIVLGCGLRGREVSTMLQLRLDTALEYYNANPGAVFIVSGGQGHDELISEALAMKEYLEKNGVPPEKIIMEDRSGSTRENFMFSREIYSLHFEAESRVVFVTSGFHTLRSLQYAKMAGFDAQPLSSPTVTRLIPQSYLREYLALMYYYTLESWRT